MTFLACDGTESSAVLDLSETNPFRFCAADFVRYTTKAKVNARKSVADGAAAEKVNGE